MQETPSNQPPGRRASDVVGADALDLLREINTRTLAIEALMASMTEAFVLNDLHKPDYDGHRKAHLTLIKAAEVMDSYKQGITKKILGWATVFILGLLASGVIAQLSGHVK